MRPGEFFFGAFESLWGPFSFTLGGTTWDLWVDPELDLDPDGDGATEFARLQAYFAGSGTYAWSADVEFVEDRLGPYPLPRAELVYLRPSVDATTVGVAMVPGQHYVYAFEPDAGTHPAHWPEAVTVHEVAHAWFGAARPETAETEWFVEAMPELLTTMRYPYQPATSRTLLDGVAHLVTGTLRGDATNLELDARHTTFGRAIKYEVGPYVLAQQYFAALATDAARTDADVWSVWASLAANQLIVDDDGHPADVPVAYQANALDASELRVAAEILTGASFYDEWIWASRGKGTPLLRIAEYSDGGTGSSDDTDPSTDSDSDPSDTDSDADTGSPHGPDEVVVEQIQQDLFGDWPVYTNVPFYLGCYPALGAESEPAFSACDATRASTTEAPYDLGTAELSVPLTPHPDLTVAASPAFVALLSAHMLLPEQVPTHLVSDGVLPDPDGVARAPTWQLRCAPGDDASLAACAADADGDGFPDLGDCNDLDSAVHPGAIESLATEADDDCDGWRGEMTL